MTKLHSRGGKRPGAGRPKKKKRKKLPVTFTMEPELITALDNEASKQNISRSQALEAILKAWLNKDTKPKAKAPIRAKAEPIEADNLAIIAAMATENLKEASLEDFGELTPDWRTWHLENAAAKLLNMPGADLVKTKDIQRIIDKSPGNVLHYIGELWGMPSVAVALIQGRVRAEYKALARMLNVDDIKGSKEAIQRYLWPLFCG